MTAALMHPQQTEEIIMTADKIRTTQGRGRLFSSILETVGDTPVIRINNLAPEGVRLYVKAEFFNPAASVKDRLALNIIEAAERAGTLKPGQTVVEATSGNTGIGLAMVCAQKGYPLVVTMADSFSVERRRLMRMLGAKVVLTPRAEKGMGMYKKAVELADKHGWFLARQFETSANADIHEATTAREIINDFAGDRLDCVVTGFGTGGTVAGLSRVLRKERPDTRIILSEPENAALITSGVAQERGAGGAPAASHPAFEPHPIQGWTPDFIPLVLQEALDSGGYDQLIPVSGADGIAWAKKLASREGILTGISGGSSFAVAMQIAEQAEKGAVILAMLPDTGERYLSTPLFADIPEEMDDDERALSDSTPGYRMTAT
jgi:cysteine synthase A